jgi:diguanylate cyclase (GGDEF)-like protein
LQISHFGYQVRSFSQAEILRQAVEKTPPAAIISDIVFPDHQLSGTQLMTEILQTIPAAPPVLFISVLDDLNARLQVARTGGKAYFTKPVNVPSLIDKLDELTARRSIEPFRILFVDDESHLATYYALILRQAGMITTVVIDPQELMATLTEFNPDLILMDIYMPLCSGPELAAVIRQQQAYVGIPIVFLSTETDLDKQLVAMSLGGDDFLTKPIQADHLILSITARAQRARTLRSLMTRDSLTGLLNHTKIKDQLTHEVLRADRQKTQLAYAMIDLDHFKSVNDSYGHASGDRVIKSLARLLQQRLRKTDIIGRYGGEEFAVILPETTGTDAVRILNEIRLGFAQVRQRSDQAELSSTFSCGIATFPQFRDVASLSSAADRALYQAKYQGRNQVVLATGGEAS